MRRYCDPALQQAFDEGAQARLAGAAPSDCRYPPGSWRAETWLQGYRAQPGKVYEVAGRRKALKYPPPPAPAPVLTVRMRLRLVATGAALTALLVIGATVLIARLA